LKLELNNKNNSKKHANNWRLNNTLLDDQWVTEEIRPEIKRFLEGSKNENTTYQNLWDRAKAVLKGKFIATSTYIKSTERSQINNLMLGLKFLEIQKQAKPKTSKRRERIKIRTEVNEIETKKIIQRINKTRLVSCLTSL
jgi:predicted kinase